jgi:hypothetical protein
MTQLAIKEQGWGFTIQWAIGSAVGLVGGFMLALTTTWSLGDGIESGNLISWVVVGLILGGGIGAGLGIPQWLILRYHGYAANSWAIWSILFGALGFAITLSILVAIMGNNALENMTDSVGGLIMGGTAGLSVGVGQWLAMKQWHSNGLAWVGIMVVTMVIAFTLALSLGDGLQFLGMGAMGLIAGIFTALGFQWLMAQNNS